MRRRNIFLRSVGSLARKFRAFQESWILPWWCSGGVVAIPLWALDILVLAAKLCSTCVMAVIKVLLPPAMKNLSGETVLITGAGAGIGRELAIQFAALGATVVCWDKDTRRNNAVVEEIRNKDGDCFGYTVDVTVRDQAAAMATMLRRQLTDVSMVISNAGASTCAPLCQLRPETVVELIEVNLMAHVWMIQGFLPNMIDRRQGHIVAINSSLGLIPCADMVPYCAAKFGLRGITYYSLALLGLMDSLSEELRLDTRTKNINTTSVYLSTVSTGLYPTPSHRFVSCYSEISAKEAARIIIQGIRKNKKCVCIPSYIKFLHNLVNFLPYRIRVIIMDFFNFGCRGWFCFC